MSIKALEYHIAPIMPFINETGVTEICINRPNEIYVEKDSRFIRHEVKELEYRFLESLASLVAEFNHKDFPSPLLSGSLPTGERIQFVMPPACEKDKIICSIRKHQMKDMRLEDYVTNGAFSDVLIHNRENNLKDALNDEMKKLYKKNDALKLIQHAIHAKKNILISGGTGTGKTTFLNACLKCIPARERLITVEDTREVSVEHANSIHLLFNEEDKRVTALNLFKVCLRLRPDRIFLSELRGAEVWPYLRAANSGHPGSLSTVHADTHEGAITQLVFMMQQAGSTSSEERIREYIKSIIHVVVQLKRDSSTNNRFMYVSEIYFSG